MFHLEHEIADWRQQMLAAGIQTPVPLEELESHLREDIERQMKSGINAQQAFENAIQQIGKAKMLKNEFEKFDGAKELRAWRQIKLMFFAGFGLISLFITACVIFKFGSFSGISPSQQMSGVAAAAVMIFLAGGGYLSHRFFPVILNKRMRDAICISSGVLTAIWWAIFLNVILARFDFTTSQLVITFLWGFAAPFGALAGFVIGLEKAAWTNLARASS
jgi:cation transport ATPase